MDRTIKKKDVNLNKIGLLKPFQCRVCFKTYTNKYRLGLHVDSKHGGVRYPCDQCGYEATQKSSLITHNNAVHANIKYQCDKCEYKATQKSSLKTHQDSIHTSVKFACDQCIHETSKRSNLIKHKDKIISFFSILKFEKFSKMQISNKSQIVPTTRRDELGNGSAVCGQAAHFDWGYGSKFEVLGPVGNDQYFG